MVLVFLVGLGYGGWVEMNRIISTSTNTKNTKKKKKKSSLGPHNCKKKSQSKSVMDAGGGTGSNPLSLSPSLQEAKKIKIWGPYTETLPYEERKGQFILL